MLTPSTIKRWLLGVILILVLSPLLGTVYTYTRAGESTRVYAATPSTLNFQARLMGSSGALVADGTYSIEFKLYTAVSGGTNEWTETQSVTVKNGYLSAHLGTSTPFSGSIDWSQEKWLTMNVNGDGEMSPRIKLTAVPYAFRAGQADSLSITGGSITGDNLLQKAPGSVQSLSSANAGLRFNQTGAGSLIQLQGDGLDIFTVSKAGDISTAGNLAILGGIGTFGNSTQAGSIILSDGSSHTGTLSTTNLTANRTYTLPDVSGTICLTTTCGPGASFIQNGNTFGTDGVLGTTDAYALRFITQNTEKFTILANGNIGVGDTTPAALFTVGTGDALQINSSGNLVTTGSLTSAGLSVTAGGASINGGLNLNFGDIFNAGAISSISTGYSTFAANGTLNAYGYFRSVDTSDSVSHFEIGAYDISGSFAGGRNLVLNPIGGNVGIGGDTTPDGLFSVGATSQFQVNSLGNVLSVGINNSNGGITNTGALSGVTTLSASGAITAASSGNTINGLIINSGSLSGITGFNQTSGNFSVTGSGAITLGANSNALTIDSTAFDVSSTGALSGITTIALSGSISGATTNTINGLNINSGTLSGVTGLTFTSGNLVLNSGSISGVTTLTTSGNINTTGGAFQTNSIDRIENDGDLVNIGNLTASGAITIASSASGNISLNSAGTIEFLDNTNVTGNLDVSGTLNIGTNNALKVDADGSLTTTFRALNGSTTATSASGLSPGTIQVGSGNTANFDVGNYVLVNGMYAKITSKTTSALSITPNLTWANGATVTEYYVPEIGGTNTGSTLTNRFGRGYFIAGVATGNGTTYYNEDSIITSLTSFDLLNTGVTTLNIGGAATTLNIGNSSTTVNVLGNLQTSGSQTITAGGGLVVSSGGINNNGGGIIGTGALSGVTTISASGAITAASSGNTINGLIINSGALSGVTGITFTSGGLNLSNGGITNAGSITGITGLTFISGGLNLNGGGITNAGTIGGVTGLTFISGNLALGGGNITGAASISASTAVTTPSVTNAGILTLSATGAGNDVILSSADQIQINAGTTIELQDNTNITGALNITGAITNTASAKFNTAAGNPAYAEGLLFYDNTQKALSYYNSESEVTLNLGLENYIYVYNSTGATITDGQVVYVNGVNAGVPTVALARSDVVATAHAAGVATHPIEAGTYGFITAFGEINGLNTNAFNAGDTVYLSSTTAGALTNVRPTQPSFTTIIGKVTEKSITIGKVVVNLSGYQYGAYTPGAIAFGGSDGNVKQDATNFFWDDTNNRLGLGDATPAATLTVGSGDLFQVAGATGNVLTTGTITINSNTSDYQIIRSGVTYAGIDLICGNNSHPDVLNIRGGIITSSTGCEGIGLSDERLKTNVVTLESSVLDRIKDVNVVNFDFICEHEYFSSTNTSCDNERQTGVLAQQLATVFPELTYQDEYGYYHVKYDALAMYSFRGVGELSKKLDSQGNATLNTVSTGGILRLTQSGTLQNINGLNLSSGGASIVGGLNNNGGGITNIGALTGVTNLSAQSISLNATGNQNLLTLTKDGNGVFTVFNSGALELKLDSASALAVKGSNGENALNVDTLTGKVKIGSGNNGKTVLFVLDTKSSDGDPAGVNGAQYYNSKMNKFRCYQNDRWQDCLQTAFSEYGIAAQRQTWTQPAGDHEIPGENRTWIDLGNANQIRILTNMAVAANQGATCRLQYSLTDTNPTWHDLSATGTIQIDKTGALKSDWVQVVDEAKKEVLVRALCSGGNGIATPDIITIRTQVR